jgi:hypothetical protein
MRAERGSSTSPSRSVRSSINCARRATSESRSPFGAGQDRPDLPLLAPDQVAESILVNPFAVGGHQLAVAAQVQWLAVGQHAVEVEHDRVRRSQRDL